MKNLIEKDTNKLSDRDLENYLNKLDKIVERTESNHFKWYIISLSILAFSITLFSFTFNLGHDLNIEYRILLFTIISISINIISVLSFYNSWKFLRIGRAFRNLGNEAKMQKSFLGYNWKKYNGNNKLGFVFWSHVTLFFMTLLASIIFPLFNLI